MNENLREYSRSQFTNYSLGQPTSEQIALGCQLRVADATEAMAKNFVALQADRDWYKRRYESECADSRRMLRRINSLRGVITKLKRKAKG